MVTIHLLLCTVIVTSAKEGAYVFTLVCLPVRWITETIANGF